MYIRSRIKRQGRCHLLTAHNVRASSFLNVRLSYAHNSCRYPGVLLPGTYRIRSLSTKNLMAFEEVPHPPSTGYPDVCAVATSEVTGNLYQQVCWMFSFIVSILYLCIRSGQSPTFPYPRRSTSWYVYRISMQNLDLLIVSTHLRTLERINT